MNLTWQLQERDPERLKKPMTNTGYVDFEGPEKIIELYNKYIPCQRKAKKELTGTALAGTLSKKELQYLY